MESERKAFSFYRSYYEASKDLPREAQADFLMGICAYIFDGVEPDLQGVASAMFKLAKPTLDTSIKRASAGQTGGKSKANAKQADSKPEANDKQTDSNDEANPKRYMINDYMINDQMINDKEKIDKKEKPQRHKHGQYKNVLLSDDEIEKLKTEFPLDWQDRIERVSEYVASTGKHYSNFLAVIRAWAKKDRPRIVAKNDVQSGLAQALQLLGEENG